MTTARLPRHVSYKNPPSPSDSSYLLLISSTSSPRLLGPRAIILGGIIPRPTSEDLAALNENERGVVQFSLSLEDTDASGQAAIDDAEEVLPGSQPEELPSVTEEEAAAEKEINLRLSDLLPIRWTGTDFEFDEEIDPEQELILQTNPPAGFSFLIPADHQRPWTPPAGYACVYESWFTSCSLWWPLPEVLTTYCHRRRIALGQYTANGIRILVTLTVLAAELGISMSVCLFEELTTPSITAKTGFFYGKMVPKYNVITGKPSKVNFWNRAYFYVKINDASFEDPSIVLNGYFNANIDGLSKWSQGGTQSFLEEVEAIRTLSHQHWPDISEARIQAALKRLSRATDSSPYRNPRMGKVNLSSLPSYADTIGTPIHGGGSSDSGRPVKRRRPTNTEESPNISGPTRLSLNEGLVESADDASQHQGPSREELPMPSSTVPTDSVVAENDAANREEDVGYPHVLDFRYQHTSVPFVEDNEAPARLFRQIQLKKKGMPELEELSQSNRYREMTRAGAIFFGSANLMVRDYEAKLKAQDEKITSKTGALKKKRREIAELAYKCNTFEEQIGTLTAEKVAAAENAEILSKELEELKALNGGLENRCRNLEQENLEILSRFETTTRRLRESREHEVRKERLRVDSVLKNQIAPTYEKMRQFIEEQPSIQSKLALFSQAKGIRESLEKIHSQGLSMEEILQQARDDEMRYHGEIQEMEIAPTYEKMRQFIEEQPSIQSKLALFSQAKGIRESLEKIHSQGLSMEEILQQARDDEMRYHGEIQEMEVVEASEIDLSLIGIDEHGSNMAILSPQDVEDLRSG
ncbi:hypothetical protein N665_5399s0001 [Sinapis alba]|nr:hypothetical protein N665_5399s0001 [Sinapis alba]